MRYASLVVASVLGFIVMASCAGAAPATVTGSFYVNCGSGSDSASGTRPQAAWKSLAKVSATKFGPGSTVYLADGCQWDGGVTLRGTGLAAARITLTSYGSGSAPIVNHSQGHAAAAITLDGSYMTVSGLSVTHATGPGVDVEGSNGVVAGMSISDAGEGVLAAGANAVITGDAASNLIMENNTPGGDDDYGAVGYDIQAPNATVTHDSCINCKAPSDDFGYDGGFVEVWESGDNLYVADNWAQNTEGFIEVGGDGKGTHANNITVVDNMLDNDDDVAILHYGDDAALPATNFVFEQNTVYQTGSSLTGQLFTWSPSASETVENNIFDVNMEDGSVPTKHSNNLYFENGGHSLGYALGSHELMAEPRFVSASANDFHLTAASPARALGAAGLSLLDDIGGVARPSVPDAGAYQFSTGASGGPSPPGSGASAVTATSGSAAKGSHKRLPKLRITAAIASRRRGARVSGTAARAFSGKVALVVNCGSSRSHAGRRPRKGRFTAHLKLPGGCRSARTARVSVRWQGSRRFARQHVAKRVRIH